MLTTCHKRVGLQIPLLLALALSSPAYARMAVLPPPEYDRPYEGLIELRVDNVLELKNKCNNPFNPPSIPLGCAWTNRPAFGQCTIILMPDDVIRAAGFDPDHVRRHEIGHCHGWPSSHPNAR